MITFSDVSTANYNIVQFVVHGDGTGQSISVNLTKPPFNISFNGNTPVDFICSALEEGQSATATMESTVDGDILTVAFDFVIPTDGSTIAQVSFAYPNVA